MAQKVGHILADQIEPGSGIIGAIEFEHWMIHAGKLFNVTFDNDVTNTNEMSVIAFNIPDNAKIPHIVLFVSATALAQVSLYESPSIDEDEGTQKDIINRNFNSDNTSILTSIEATPVANQVTTFNETQAADASISTTTEKWTRTIGQAGNPATKSGGESRGDSEFMLKPGKQYAIVVKALDDNDNHHHISLNWYELIPVIQSIEYTRAIV